MTDPSKHLLLLSGPNLDQLGHRQPEIYGTATLADHVATATTAAEAAGWSLDHVQSNHEGDLVGVIGAARGQASAIVINAGALTHYGWSLHDALAGFDGVVVELHLSNPSGRQEWRHQSVVAPVADAVVAGAGGMGYRLAVEAAIEIASR